MVLIICGLPVFYFGAPSSIVLNHLNIEAKIKQSVM